MYTSTVVPLDGSEFGKRALPVALALARRSDAVVHLVHVHEGDMYPGGGPMYDTRLQDELRAAMQSELTADAARLTRESAVTVDATFLDGRTAPTLQAYLSEHRPDLVVMSTHGRGGLSRTWIGSVADGLVRHSAVPLLLLRAADESPPALVEPLFRRILVPLDGSAMAEEVLDHVVSLGTPDATVYTLLTIVIPRRVAVLEDYPDDDSSFERAGVARQWEEALAHLNGVAAELRESGALVETRVEVHHQMGRSILDVALAVRADAIALSTHGRGAVTRFLIGSVADKVVRGATVPVLVYRPAHVRAAPPEHVDGDVLTAIAGAGPLSPWMPSVEPP